VHGRQCPRDADPGHQWDFYGTTRYRSNEVCVPWQCGTVFKITPGGRLTTLHSFCSERRLDPTESIGDTARTAVLSDGSVRSGK
jgi:uncharacterized repeat protein (TIGR03803 family)